MLWHKRDVITTVLLISAGVMVAAAAGQDAAPSASVVPRLVSFSGVVKDSAGKAVSGRASLTFSLYELEEGGKPLWVETQTVQTDDQGHYTALLGANSPDGLPLDLFTTGSARWLGIAPAVPGVGELPRVLLVGVPYALKAADAETLGGKPASAFVQTSQDLASGASVASGSGQSAVGGGPGGNTPSAASQVKQSKGKNTQPNTSIADYLPYWNGTTNVGNSAVFQSGANIGIGTTTPAFTLDVNGNFNLPATTSANVGVINLAGAPFVHACCPNSTGNTFAGTGAGNFSANASGTGGIGYNTAVGYGTMPALSSGYYNSAIGTQALYSNTSGYYNTASGVSALRYNTTGNSNTATGEESLLNNKTGGGNTGDGLGALMGNTTGASNTAVGFGSLNVNSSGNNNTGLGLYAGFTTGFVPTTGNNNTFIGANSGVGTQTGLNYATAIGAGATVTESNALVLGGTGPAAVNVGIGTSTPNNPLEVVGNWQGGNIGGALRITGDKPTITLNSTGGNTIPISIHSGSDSNGGLEFYKGIGNTQFLMGVYGNGNVGIGTVTPNYALDVSGSLGIGNNNGSGSSDRLYLARGDPNHYIYSSGTNGNTTYFGEYNGSFNFVNANGGANVMVLSGGNLTLSTSGAGIVFPDGSKQTKAAGGGITGVTAGTDLTGGGTSGNVKISLDTTKVPQLAAANTFSASQTITGSGNGIAFPDGSKLTTANLAYTNVAQVYGNGSAANLSCPSGYIADTATCTSGGSIIINDATTPLPPNESWVGYLTPSASNATGLHCNALGVGAQATAIVRCARLP